MSSRVSRRVTRPVTLVAWLIVGAALVAACAATGSGGAASPSPVASATGEASPSSATRVLEDMGLETPMPAGSYESRLFEPALRLELGDGWFRRDANSDRILNLRRGPNGVEDVTFLAGPDFLQCGLGEIVEDPNATVIADAIAAAEPLTASGPIEVAVGSATGTMIRLAGGGEPIAEEDIARLNDFGCVLTLGEDPFPAEAAWVPLTSDAEMQLVLVDVDGTTVLIRARGDTAPEAHFELVLDLLEETSLG